jgi:hypothetical protein
MTSTTRLTKVATTIMVVAGVALGSLSAAAAGGQSIAFAAAATEVGAHV